MMENGSVWFCKNSYPNSTILQETCFLRQEMGNQEMRNMNVFGTVLYAIIFTTGVFGNISTCVVIKKHKLLKTSTNTYLFNLAIADLVTLIIGLPFEVYMVWHPYPWSFPDIVCHMKGWIFETTSYVSVLTILAFSVERYLAVCHSFSFRKYQFYRKRLRFILGFLWVLAGLCAAPFGVYHIVDYAIKESPFDPTHPLEDSKMCVSAFIFDPSLEKLFEIMFHISAFAFFVLPMLILMFIYQRVFMAVRKSRRTLLRTTKCESMINVCNTGQDYHSRKVLWILVSVVGVFFCCYAPFQLQRLMFSYVDPQFQAEINNYLFWISGFLFYLAATLNPVMYNVISHRYRRAFMDILCRGGTQDTTSHITTPKNNYRETTTRSPRTCRCGAPKPSIYRARTRQNMPNRDLILLDSKAAGDVLL